MTEAELRVILWRCKKGPQEAKKKIKEMDGFTLQNLQKESAQLTH